MWDFFYLRNLKELMMSDISDFVNSDIDTIYILLSLIKQISHCFRSLSNPAKLILVI
jgi:hypothetical protein